MSVAGSNSPSSPQAVTTLRPACVTSPSGRKWPCGRAPVSSSNSRLATTSASSPSEYSPFAIIQAPASFLAQNGPPGCTSRTSTSPPRRRKFETALEPCRKPRRCGKIHVDRAADDRGDVEIGDREVFDQQISAAGQRIVEHLERPLQHLERLGEPLRIAILERQPPGVQRPDVDAAVDLLH